MGLLPIPILKEGFRHEVDRLDEREGRDWQDHIAAESGVRNGASRAEGFGGRR